MAGLGLRDGRSVDLGFEKNAFHVKVSDLDVVYQARSPKICRNNDA